MNEYVLEYLEGCNTYKNHGLESAAAMEFFLRHEHQIAYDEGFYEEFMFAFPRFFQYLNAEQEFLGMVGL